MSGVDNRVEITSGAPWTTVSCEKESLSGSLGSSPLSTDTGVRGQCWGPP